MRGGEKRVGVAFLCVLKRFGEPLFERFDESGLRLGQAPFIVLQIIDHIQHKTHAQRKRRAAHACALIRLRLSLSLSLSSSSGSGCALDTGTGRSAGAGTSASASAHHCFGFALNQENDVFECCRIVLSQLKPTVCTVAHPPSVTRTECAGVDLRLMSSSRSSTSNGPNVSHNRRIKS